MKQERTYRIALFSSIQRLNKMRLSTFHENAFQCAVENASY